MPKFIIERDIPGLGQFPPEKLQAISQKSRSVLEGLGPRIQWLESYVTDNKLYCVYIAPDAEMIREHDRSGGFPAERIVEVHRRTDPTTAEG